MKKLLIFAALLSLSVGVMMPSGLKKLTDVDEEGEVAFALTKAYSAFVNTVEETRKLELAIVDEKGHLTDRGYTLFRQLEAALGSMSNSLYMAVDENSRYKRAIYEKAKKASERMQKGVYVEIKD